MADRADARRLHAIRVAEEAGDLGTWIEAVVGRYETRRERGAAESELRADRLELLVRADGLRSGTVSRLGRLWAGQRLDAAFGRILRDVLAQPNPDPAEVCGLNESAKARMLLDALAGHWVQPSRAVAAELGSIEHALMAYGSDSLDGPVWDEMRLTSELALGRAGLRSELDDLEDRYRAAGAGFGGVAPISDLDEVVASLEPGELLVEYVIPHHPLHPSHTVWILVARDDGVALVPALTDPLAGGGGFIGRITTDDHAPVDISPLGQAIVNLRSATQDDERADAETALRSLHELLVEPLVAAGIDVGDASRTVVIPHRMLHPVPFAALLDARGRRLVDTAAIVTAPSASVWSALRRRQRPLRRHCLALANPTMPDAELEPLPDAEAEVAEIARSLAASSVTADVRIGDRASAVALATAVADAGIVYLATHGGYPENDALDQHCVYLAADADDDGVVTADEIRRLDLTEVWTVVLSVCDGGLYRFGPGDEPLGLVPALLAAGAQNVVATLWEIDDVAGRELMVLMGQHLVELGPAEALRRAAVAYSAAHDVAVRDWAAFSVTGSGDPPR